MSPAVLPSPVLAAAQCAHCGLPSRGQRFCCIGCETVFGLLEREGLGRYYSLGRGAPVADEQRIDRADRLWLELEAANLRQARGLTAVQLDVQGMHCSACVWLVQELFRRTGARGRVRANPSTGRCELLVDADFPLVEFVDRVSQFGYRFGSAKQARPARSQELLWRMGVCIAIAMNTMIFAIAMYAGLDEGPTHTLFTRLDLALSLVSVVVGGPVFFRSALASLRRGVLHLDLPIALGIVLAFASSMHSAWMHAEGGVYFDTLNVFIALMLVGRFVQERALEKNRSYLLESDGADDLLARRLAGDAVDIVAATALKSGDRVVLTPGDLLATRAVLHDASASLSLDWIDGESEPRRFAAGDVLPAGAFLAQPQAITVTCSEDFAQSDLRQLLRQVPEDEASTRFWQRYVSVYVSVTLSIAALGFAAWSTFADVWRASEVVAGVLIVTCPCAVGIATPLAYDLVHAGLRRSGLFVRRAGLLDRLLAVRRVVFDKTGTLTTGHVRLRDESVLDALTPAQQGTLYDLAVRSSHPKASALHAPLRARGARYHADFSAQEQAGLGVQSGAHRLGAAHWALDEGVSEERARTMCFAENGRALLELHTEEVVREGAAADLAGLTADGQELFVLSGDRSDKVRALAARFGLGAERCRGDTSPEAKRQWVEAHDPAHTLMIGDGVNDTLALAAALCSGTPATDRPIVAARSDFFFTGTGFSAVRLALRAARLLRRVVLSNVALGALYNLITVGLALSGSMSPLLCAIVMPVSSVSLLLLTTHHLSTGARLWKS